MSHDQSLDLPSRPISDEEYHDYRLVGLLLKAGEAELTLEGPGRIRTKITLKGIERLMAVDVLEANLIDCVDCHQITADNVGLILGEFTAVKSPYFTEKAAHDINASGSIINKLFVAVRPAYGATLLAIAADVTETNIEGGGGRRRDRV